MTKRAAKEPREEMPGQKYVLKLCVGGSTPRSSLAQENIRVFCEEHLKGRYELEVIDIYKRPEALQKYQVIAAPTLIRVRPLPQRRLIGDMSDHLMILKGLSLRGREGKKEAEENGCAAGH